MGERERERETERERERDRERERGKSYFVTNPNLEILPMLPERSCVSSREIIIVLSIGKDKRLIS